MSHGSDIRLSGQTESIRPTHTDTHAICRFYCESNLCEEFGADSKARETEGERERKRETERGSERGRERERDGSQR